MVTGKLLIAIFIFSIAFLLVAIIKFKLNAFVSLILTSFITAILVGMPLAKIGGVITDGFGGTMGGIGIVTGLGVMLGIFLFEAGGIESIANTMIQKFGEKKSPAALSVAAFFAGIPVFGDVCTIMFAPMLRTLSRKTGIARVTFVCAVALSSSITYAMVVPTPAPLAVAETLGLDVGIYFVYALLTAIVGSLIGTFVCGGFLNKYYKKKNITYVPDAEELEEIKGLKNLNTRKLLPFGKAVIILLVPIVLIVAGSFGAILGGDESAMTPFFKFFGDKNVAMLIGVFVAVIMTKPYLEKSVSDIMNEAAGQVGLIMLITGAGGSFGKVIQTTGIGDYLAQTLSTWNISILILCFLLSQIIRSAQGSTTVALLTTSSILQASIIASGISPILAAIAICAGGVGLSLPNDSGFWAVHKFNKITIQDTFRAWTIGGFVCGIGMLIFVMILSAIQGVLPGLI